MIFHDLNYDCQALIRKFLDKDAFLKLCHTCKLKYARIANFCKLTENNMLNKNIFRLIILLIQADYPKPNEVTVNYNYDPECDCESESGCKQCNNIYSILNLSFFGYLIIISKLRYMLDIETNIGVIRMSITILVIILRMKLG